ncbi:MAG: hypothetical protein EP338_10655 [Bacteroidetes bacterium]|nr:MAG: hypothetical protein EP338_10655 [Bacteroidota bacterium]
MRTLAPFAKLNKIEFQSDSTEVTLSCSFYSEHEYFDGDMIISQSDLNKLFGSLQQQNEELDLYEMIETQAVGSDYQLYSLNLEHSDVQNALLPQELLPQAQLRIRA